MRLNFFFMKSLAYKLVNLLVFEKKSYKMRTFWGISEEFLENFFWELAEGFLATF